MKRAFLSILGGLGGALAALVGPAEAAPTAAPTIGRIIALPPVPAQPEAAAPVEPIRFAGNTSSNSSRNSSRNRSSNSSNNTSSNTNNNSSDDDRRGWRRR